MKRRVTSDRILEPRREVARHRQRAKLAVPYAVRWAMLREAGLRCAYCGGQGDTWNGPDGNTWQTDHRTPLCKGGSFTADNLAMCCRRCNMTKGAKTVAELLTWLATVEPSPHRLLMAQHLGVVRG